MNPMQLLNNPQMFQEQLNNFKFNVQQKFGTNVNPQQILQQLLNSGQMTQSQFNDCLNMANKFIGKRF